MWAPSIHKTLRTAPAMAAGVTRRIWEIGDIVDVLEAFENRRGCCLNQTDTPENEEAVRDLRRTAFSSQCWPIAGSLKRRFVDRELSPKPLRFDGLVHVPARERIVYCLVVTGEREP
jgi:hypothetical protein